MATMTSAIASSFSTATPAALSQSCTAYKRVSTPAVVLRRGHVKKSMGVEASLSTVFLGERLQALAFDKPQLSIARKAKSLRPGSAEARDRLQISEFLTSEQNLISSNGKFQLRMQWDNNLVIYDNRNGRPIWASNTWDPNNPNSSFAIMQGDGNFVTYKNGVPTFASGTFGVPAAYIVMQDDGNLVIYNSANRPTWASGSWQPDWQSSPPHPATAPAPSPPVIAASFAPPTSQPVTAASFPPPPSPAVNAASFAPSPSL